ncbi:MAG: condensation domain-containing protein [Dermatophilaceae bacterium]
MPWPEQPLPLTAAQEGMLLHQLAHPASAAYHTAIAFVLPEGCDRETFARAVAHVAQVHPMMCSRFVVTTGGAGRLVDPASIGEVTWAPPCAGADETVAAALVAAPIDVRDGAFRVVVTPRPDGDLVVVVGHHIATDAHSNAVLLTDLIEAYAALAAGADWPPDGRPWLDEHAVGPAERRVRHDPRARAELAELRELWGDAVVAELPLDRPRPATSGGSGRTVRRRLGPQTAGAVAAAAAGLRVTPFAVLLGCFEALVWDYVRTPAFLLGVPMSRRTSRQTQRVVGNFVNLAAVRADVDRLAAVGDVVAGAAAAARESYRRIGVAYADVVAEGGLPPPASGGTGVRLSVKLIGSAHLDPLTDAFLRCDGAVVRHRGIAVRPVAVPQSEGQLDLTAQVQWSASGMLLDLRYDDEILDEESVAVVADRLVGVLERASADPQASVAAVLRG